jgi:hypothetical protein
MHKGRQERKENKHKFTRHKKMVGGVRNRRGVVSLGKPSKWQPMGMDR